MRITDFRTLVWSTPWRNVSTLILETDAGIVGYGESRIVNKTHAVLEYLRAARRHFVGHDPFDIEDLYRRMTLLDTGTPGEIVMTGLAMVEMACWDLIGKACDQPVYRLLGGKVRDTVPAYANGWYRVERRPEAFAAAARAVVERGYRAMKFDPFGDGDLQLSREEFRRSVDLVAAVRQAVGEDVELYIEMHARFAAHQAIEIVRAIEAFRPGWIEEPCRPQDLEGLERVRRHSSLPIATGEKLYGACAFTPLLRAGAADILQPDITQCGGVLEVKKIASTAEAHGLMVAPHNVGGIVSTAAALHVLVTLRNGLTLEHFNDFVDPELRGAGSGYPEVVDGCFGLPGGPGWGVELDEDTIRAHPPKVRDDGVVLDPVLGLFQSPDWNLRNR